MARLTFDETLTVGDPGHVTEHIAAAKALNSFGIVTPSGDATGATDAAAINAALVAGDTRLTPGSYTIGAPIVMPSGRRLTLDNADVVRIPGTQTWNAWVVVNKGVADNGSNNVGTITIADADITITGVGNSRLRTTPAAWTRSGNLLWLYIGILFVKVTGLIIEGVRIGPTQSFGACLQGVARGRIYNVHLDQDEVTPNQDGLDVGPGCTDILMEGITGHSGDDFFSVFAHHSASSMHPAVNETNSPGTAGDIVGLVYRNVSAVPGINFFRLNSGGGRTLRNVQIADVSNPSLATMGGTFLQIGQSSYSGLPLPTTAQLTGITACNIRPGRMSFLGLDNNCSNITISDVVMDGQVYALVKKSEMTTAHTANDIVISDVTYADPGTLGTISDLVNIPIGTVNRMTLRNFRVIRCQRLLNNAATITDLNVSDINIGTLGSTSAGSLIASTVAETGSIDGVTVTTYAGAFTGLFVGAAPKLRMGARMPVLTSADVTPLATTKGSRIMCDNTKQPDGGAGTTAAEWVANGTTWIKAVDLGAMAGR